MTARADLAELVQSPAVRLRENLSSSMLKTSSGESIFTLSTLITSLVALKAFNCIFSNLLMSVKE